jgi:hypothetical protein
MKSLQSPQGVPHRIKRLLCLILSASMALWGIPIPSFAQQSAISSVVIEAYDPSSGRLLPSLGGLKGGDTVRLKVKAFDRFGNSVPCTPVVEPIQGFTGNQIEGITPQGSDSLMTVGKGFGSAEIKASCQENPSVSAKEFVGVSTTLTAPRPSLLNPPPSPTPAPAPEAAAGSGGSHGGAIATAAVLGVLGVVGLAYLLMPKEHCGSGSHACGNPNDSSTPCCPNGRTVYCPNSRTCTNLDGSGAECGTGQPRRAC